MMIEKTIENASNSPFTTVLNFSEMYPEFSAGALRWLIFNRREELLSHGVIRYWGRKVLIHKENFFEFIMQNSTAQIAARH
jgi:hypothetical protein